MDDLIYRQPILDSYKRICGSCGEDKKYGGAICSSCYLDDAISIVEDTPSAQPERKTGRRIEDSDPGEILGEHWACSECHMCYGHMNANYLFHYCPNCGAKMEVDG